MSKFLSHSLLTVALAALSVASVSAQPVARLGGNGQAAEAASQQALTPDSKIELVMPSVPAGISSPAASFVLPSYNPAGIMPAPSRSDLTLPYLQEFDDAAAFGTMTVIDVNADNKTWTYESSKKCARAAYHSTNVMDDWMILPALTFETGKIYKLAFKAATNSTSYHEKIEVKIGNAATAEAMTTEIVPVTELVSKNWVVIEEFISVPANGDYYVGFHGCSDKDRFYMYVDSIAISAGMDGGAPGAATELSAVADANGALKATVSGKAPTLNIGNQALASLERIEIKRDGTLVKTITGVAPGGNFSFTDEAVPTSGNHTYTVTCFNDKGAGKDASVSVFVGYDVPAAVTGITMVETSPGVVKLDWQPVTTDANGVTLPAGSVTYTVVDVQNSNAIVAEGLTATTLTHTAMTEGQKFAQYGVFAINETGASQGVAGPFMAVGFPYAMPWKESFPDKQVTGGILGIQYLNYGSTKPTVTLCNDASFGNMASYDGDNGYVAIKTSYLNDKAGLFSGKIDLTNAQNPSFKFATYNIASKADDGSVNYDINEVDVVVREAGTEEWTVLRHATVNELCNGDTATWGFVNTSLAAYKGKVVQVGVHATCKFYLYTMFDALEVSEDLANNLAAGDITAPAKVAPNTEFNVALKVKNLGATATDAYTVEFYREGDTQPVATLPGVSLAQNASADFTITQSLGFMEADASATYYAKVVFAADENPADNTSASVTVTRQYSSKPAPTGLAGTASGSNIHLTWNAPALAPRMAGPVTESFDECESWAQTLEGWTFVDGDQSPVGGFQGSDIPGITPGTSLASFFIFDKGDGSVFNQTFDGHSGTKYLGALFRYDDGATDDWAILPELDGSAQTITFWAKSYSDQYPEKIRMMTSTTDAATGSFTAVQTVASVPKTWTQYTVEIPAGTKYFAINSCATGSFMLMVDDVTYTPKPGVAPEVVGYNIYRNGVKVNETPVTNLYYDDTVAAGTYDYHVTAVWNDGQESAPAYVQVVNGVGAVEAGVSVSTEPGKVIVAGAEGLSVAVIDVKGAIYYRGTAEGNVVVNVAPGVYMVMVGDSTVKVLVR